MEEYITYEELCHWRKDCLRHKSTKASSLAFTFNDAMLLNELYDTLNDMTYTISPSITFCTTRPKLREVFAADFRDRIIHHTLIGRYGQLIDSQFICDSYNCRRGKGTLYGVQRIQQMLQRSKPGDYILRCDIKSFFMSIDKQLMWEKLEALLREKYLAWQNQEAERASRDMLASDWQKVKHTQRDLEWLLWLTKKVVLHRPELCCVRHGDLTLWDKLKKSKSLFGSDGTKGLAIGNLTSQIYANYYLTEFDNFMYSKFGLQYGRYVDDFVCVGRKEELISVLPLARQFLKERLMLALHPKKIYLQPVSHGVQFTGSYVYADRIYAGNRTIGNFWKAMTLFNESGRYDDNYRLRNFNRLHMVVSSYLGFLVHAREYKARKKIIEMVLPVWGRYVYATNDFKRLRVKNKYKSPKFFRDNEFYKHFFMERRF